MALSYAFVTSDAGAIGNGIDALDDPWGFVVRLRGPESLSQSGASACSATVLSARWLLTAAHCTHGREVATSCGDPDEVFSPERNGWVNSGFLDSIEITLPEIPKPEGAPEDHRYRADAVHNFGGKLDPCSPTARGGDWALIRLQDPLPPTQRRLRPPGINGEPTCPLDDDFVGMIVGYGQNKLVSGTGGGTRRLNWEDGWDRIPVGSGRAVHRYFHEFWVPTGGAPTSLLLLEVEDSYKGMCAGDSGGPLVQSNPNTVDGPIAFCGVASAPKIEVWPVGINHQLKIGNDYAAIEASYAVQFISERILYHTPENPAIDGWWEGECPPPNHHEVADTDDDGVPDACDNCPNHWNPGQENADLALELAALSHPTSLGILGDACDPCYGANIDTDGDGCHDACDSCPTVAGAGFNCGDFDDDGICDDVDNCTYRPNGSQRNTNKISELVHAATVPSSWAGFWAVNEPFHLGDACEPVPTPRTKIVPEEVTPVWGPLCVAFPKAYEHDKFEVFAQKSFPMGFLGEPHTPSGPIESPVRFCHKHGDVHCDDEAGITDAWLGASECAALPSALVPGCTDPEEPTDYFHRMTFESAAMANGLDPDDHPAKLSYDRSMLPWSSFPAIASATWEWSYHADFARWTAGGLFLQGQAPAVAEHLKGALWLHASTDIGHTVDLGSGPYATGLHGEQLANHHLVSYAPYREQCATGMQWAPVEGNIPMIEIKWPGYETGPDPVDRVDAIAGEAHLIIPGGGGVWGTIGGAGSATLLTPVAEPLLAEGFRYRLEDSSLRAFSAVEPFWTQGAGAAFPLVAWLNADGGDELIDLGTFDGASLLSELDREVCPAHFTCISGYCGEEYTCEPSPADPLDLGAPHAVDYVGVLSRSRRGLFVIGGDDIATSEPTGEIWFLPLELGSWIPIPVDDHRPEKVLAATYSWITNSLYLLDEHDDGARVSLVQVKVDQPAAIVLATFARTAAWSRHDLVIDHDGALLLASSSASYNKHRIARITGLGGTPVVDGVDAGDAPLAFMPVVDVEGYTLVTLVDGTEVQRTRKEALDLEDPGTLDVLGYQL